MLKIFDLIEKLLSVICVISLDKLLLGGIMFWYDIRNHFVSGEWLIWASPLFFLGLTYGMGVYIDADFTWVSVFVFGLIVLFISFLMPVFALDEKTEMSTIYSGFLSVALAYMIIFYFSSDIWQSYESIIKTIFYYSLYILLYISGSTLLGLLLFLPILKLDGFISDFLDNRRRKQSNKQLERMIQKHDKKWAAKALEEKRQVEIRKEKKLKEQINIDGFVNAIKENNLENLRQYKSENILDAYLFPLETFEKKLSAVGYAAYYGYGDIIRYLKSKQANMNIIDDEGYTPLMRAVSKNNIDTVKLLLDFEVDVDSFIVKSRNAND